MLITVTKSSSRTVYWIHINDQAVIDAKSIAEASRFADALQSSIYIASGFKARPDVIYKDGADLDYNTWLSDIANRSH